MSIGAGDGRRAILLATAAFLAGCASTGKESGVIDAERTSWTGRMGLKVASEPPQSFSAGFSLSGNAQAGELSLTSPLGSVLALMKWEPGSATLCQGGQERHYGSLEELVAQTLGAPIPVRALFAWLRGVPQAVEGWHADLSALGNGRLTAQRLQPLPVAELRLALD